MKTCPVRLAIVVFLLTATAWAYSLTSGALNPKSYHSESGEYEFVVDPKDRTGSGAAHYVYTQKGETKWTKDFPYTLVDVRISQSGLVIGHANTVKRDADHKQVTETFVVVLIDRDGNVKFQEERVKDTFILHGPALPCVSSLHLDDRTNRAIAEITAGHKTPLQWMIFDVSTAQWVDTVSPVSPKERTDSEPRLDEMMLIPGASLVLTAWDEYDYRSTADSFQINTYFAVHDLKGKLLWSLLDKPKIATKPDDSDDSSETDEIDDKSLLTVGESPTFDVWLKSTQHRATYSIERAADAMISVREISRVPYTPKRKQVAVFEMPAFPEMTVEKPITVSLQGRENRGEKRSEWSSIFDFDIAQDGSICSLRRSAGDKVMLVLNAPDGDVLGEIEIPNRGLPSDVDHVGPAWLSDHRFVATACGYESKDRAKIFVADFDTQTITAFPDADCPKIRAMAGFRDGRFVALTERDGNFTSFDGLYFFNADGSIAWSREQHGTDGSPEELFSPEDIARIDENSFVILENIGDKLKIFDTNNTLVNVTDLEETWGREPNYPTDVFADPSGGFLVYDFHAPKPIVWMDSTGTIKSEGVPRYDDGRPFSPQGGIKVSPDGVMWTSDGAALLQLSEDGVVQSTLGPKPNLDDLDEPYYVTVGPNGKIYIGDQRTKALHVFDSNGAHIGVCKPVPGDLTETSDVEDVAVTPSGEMYVHFGDDIDDIGKGATYVHFGADFARIEKVGIKAERSVDRMRFQSSGAANWQTSFDDLYLCKNIDENKQAIGRTSKNQWIEYISSLAVASDGGAAILSGHIDNGYFISTFAADGNPLTSFEITKDWQYADIAYDGSRIYTLVDGEVCVMEQDGKPVGKFKIASKNDVDYIRGPFFSSARRELWFVVVNERTLLKFAV